MTMAFETNRKAEPLWSGSALSVARNPVPWVNWDVFYIPSGTHILYINNQWLSTAFLFLFVSACRNNRNYLLWVQGGQTHTHTHRRTPERRRTTAGRTAHTNHARRTAGREETGTQRQPKGKPAERQARQAEPQPRGNHDGRWKRTKRTHTHRRRTRKQRTNNTGNTPKVIICLLALIFIYQVFNYKVKGFTRRLRRRRRR